MQFRIQATFGPPDQLWLVAPFFRLEAVRWAYRWVASDHQDIASSVLRLGQFPEDAFEHTVFRPPPKPVVEHLAGTVFSGGIGPL